MATSLSNETSSASLVDLQHSHFASSSTTLSSAQHLSSAKSGSISLKTEASDLGSFASQSANGTSLGN